MTGLNHIENNNANLAVRLDGLSRQVVSHDSGLLKQVLQYCLAEILCFPREEEHQTSQEGLEVLLAFNLARGHIIGIAKTLMALQGTLFSFYQC